jgi:adenine-specific DNA-methyltransferase
MANNKLELTWLDKDKPIKVEPRLLIENPKLSNIPANINQNTDGIFDNLLIHGDNLIALKSLESKYAGKIKCIYIDPPYNTGSAFEHYDDNLEHSTWLSLMKPRLEILRNLLSNNGSVWISIDSYESHYLKVLCDEVFGRFNFVEEVIWQRSYAPINLKKYFSRNHDTILIYAKDIKALDINLLPRSDKANGNFSNPDNDPRGPWASGPIQVGPRNENRVYKIVTPSGKIVLPPPQYCWRYSEEKLKEMIKDNRVYFGPNGSNTPRIKRFLSEVKQGIVPLSLWLREDSGDNQEAKKEIKILFGDDVFDTPKPERLIQKILLIASNKNDLVMDSFLGSGTTIAVAHKMGRRWIGVELGNHAYTHCKLRIDKVIEGEQGGISREAKWKNGGGYRFYEVAPTLIKIDSFGQAVINSEYNADMLAAAVALHEGYNYEPDQTLFWKQAKNGESSYLFTTTRHLDRAFVDSVASQMTENDFLVISCKSFDALVSNLHKNIAIKKIPQSLLKNCEFDKDNYNLNIINPPVFEGDEEDE